MSFICVDTTEADKAKVITAAKEAVKSVSTKANVDVDSLVKGLSPSKDPPPPQQVVQPPAQQQLVQRVQATWRRLRQRKKG